VRLRLLAFAFTAIVSLAAAPSARADPAAIYPLGTLRAGPEDVSDVRALLDAALHRTERRGGLAPAGQPARAACGPATAAEAACLARLAGAGVVLLGVVERAGSTLEPGDAARYQTVDTYNSVSVALLAAGSVATAAGIVLWATAPDVRPVRGGATLGVSGHF
jgi:hypothetical protein